MRDRSFWVILCSSVVVALVAVFVSGDVGDYAVLGWGITATVLQFRASRKHTGKTRRFMNGIVWTSALICIGFVVRGIHGEMVGQESPIPSPADLLHIPAYLLFLRSAILAHRARSPRPNSDAWLDAGAVVTSLVMVLWVTFFADYVLSDTIPMDTRVVNGIYNLIILVTFTVFVRITSTPGTRSPVYYLLGSAGFSYFVVDLAASYSLVRGEGLWLTIALSPIVFGLLAAALRHPAAGQLLDRDLEAEVSIGPLRLSIVSAAIVAPVLVLEFGRDQSALSIGVLVVASGILSLLVITRVLRLLVDQRDTALLDRQLAAEMATMTSLESKQAIIDYMPTALARFVGERASIDLVDDVEGIDVFPLPEALRSGSIEAVRISGVPHNLPPATHRVVESLVRDAGLLVDSIAGLEAQARQQSEAEANRRIAASERRFRSLVERSTDMIAVIDSTGSITYVSDAVARILGHAPDELIGSQLSDLLHHNDVETFFEVINDTLGHTGSTDSLELRFIDANDSTHLLRLLITDMCGVPEINGLVINASDVTERRRLERDLLDAKVTDRLTLLPNRIGFIEELELSIRRNDVTDTALAVAVVNLRNFKAVNDALGPSVADEVLVRCAALIRREARAEDTVGRLGGDEFVVLMRDPRSAVDAVATVERLLSTLAEPMTLESGEIHLQGDGGVVFSYDSDAEALGLLRDADIALTAAKRSDSSSVVLFEPEMAAEASEQMELRSGIGRGMTNGEFRLVFQPVVEIQTGRIRSLEALARWKHPRLGHVSPLTFISLAEQSGQINDLGDWALRTACSQLSGWESQGLCNYRVGVNMSVYQLHQPDIVNRTENIVRSAGATPEQVIIEITESVLIDNGDLIAERMRDLRARGFALAIDDFGTGYSSLGYLQRYEFDILKIDKVFVDPLVDPSNQREREVVRSIIQLAAGLGAVTVAEGIEEESQLEVLRELGCDFAQGYLLYRPAEVDDCTEILRAETGLQILN